MLHERRMPDDLFQNLEKVYLAKLRLIDWLLRSPPGALDDNDLLVKTFGVPLGKWFWARIRQPKTRTAFGDAVIVLATNALADPAKAALVADAISHDSEFHKQWNVDGNELHFPRLHADWLEPIKNVAVPFYDWFADMGYKSKPFALSCEKIDRALVMKSFRPQSRGVCGYCDGPMGELGTEFEANDCDHFFPKSQWPHLAIHPANLFSSCKGCNTTWKLAKAPMDTADALGLSSTFHPMLRPGVLAVLVRTLKSTTSARQVEIRITDPVLPQRAVKLVETLDLEVRWATSMNEEMDPSISSLVAKTVRDRGLGRNSSPDSVRQLIEDDIAWKQAQLGKEERCMRQIATLKYMRDDLLHEVIADLT